MTRTLRLNTLPAAVLALTIGSISFAQPPAPSSSSPRSPRVESLDREEMNTERLRSILERRLEYARAQQQRAEKALEMLDNGASIDELRAAYRDLFFERPMRRESDTPPSRETEAGDLPPRDARDRYEPRRDRLSPEDRAQLLAFLAEEFPDLHTRVREFIPAGPDGGPSEIDARMERRMAPLLDMMRLKERDPEMFALHKELWAADRAAWEAARKVRDASDADRAQAAEDLHTVLGRQFDLQLRQHQLELERLEARLENARRDAARQAASRDNLINERLLEILSRRVARPEDSQDRDGRGPQHDKRLPAPDQ